MSQMIRRKENVLNEKIDVNARVNMNNSYVNRRPILLCYDALVLHQIFSVAAVAIYEKKMYCKRHVSCFCHPNKNRSCLFVRDLYLRFRHTRRNTWRAKEPNVMYDTIMVEEKNNKNFHLHNILDVFLLSYEKSS